MLTTTASADTRQVTGAVTYGAAPLNVCSSPIGLCYKGTLSGDLAGTVDMMLLTAVPSVEPVGVMVYAGDWVTRTTTGNLTCGANVVTNEKAAAEGEWVGLCVVSGGTGRFAGASGYLQFTGTSSPTILLSAGQGSFVGRLSTP